MPYRSRDTSRTRTGASTGQSRYRRKPDPGRGGKWLMAVLGLTLVAFVALLIHRFWPIIVVHGNGTPTPPPDPAIRVVEDYSRIDAAVLGLQPQANESEDAFAHRLVRDAHSDTEKARAIYRWVTENISYDVTMMGHPTAEDEDVPTVMSRRKTICTGYSRLVKAMAESVGLECEIIKGWGKGFDASRSRSPDHVWNALKAGNRWMLIDATWGAGYADESGWKKDFRDAYFFTPPEMFIQSHLPSQPAWQFLNPPWTKERFDSQPHTWSSFFEMGMALGSDLNRVIHASDGQIKFWIHVPSGVYVSTQLYRGDAALPIRPQVEGKLPGTTHYEFQFDLAGQTADRVVVFASRSINGNKLSVLEYSVAN